MSTIDILLDKKDAHYYSGGRVRGLLVLNIDKPLKFTAVGVRFTGIEYPCVFTGRNRATMTRVFIDKTLDLKKSGVVQPGHHKLPFEFDLPHDLPPSYNGTHTAIKYSVVSFFGLDSLFDKLGDVAKEVLVSRNPLAFPKESGKPQIFQSDARKDKPSLSVCLKGSVFQRGKDLEGTVAVFNPSNSNIKGVTVALVATENLVQHAQSGVVYRTEYKIPAAKLGYGIPLPFSLPIPATEPITYGSSFSRVDWELEACIALSWWRKVRARRAINVFL